MNGLLRGNVSAHNARPGNALAMLSAIHRWVCSMWETPVVGFSSGFPDCHIFPLPLW